MVLASLKDGRALGRLGAAAEDEEKRELSQMGKAVNASLIGFLAAAFFLSRAFVEPLYVLFAVVAAGRDIHERDRGPLERAYVPRNARHVLVLELASIPALYVVIRLMN
jgi:hypothetical protein